MPKPLITTKWYLGRANGIFAVSNNKAYVWDNDSWHECIFLTAKSFTDPWRGEHFTFIEETEGAFEE